MTATALTPAAERPQIQRLVRFFWPPLGRREFWLVQGMVAAIAIGHSANEQFRWVDLHEADFIPVSMFLLPVVYAGLVFGTRGATLTAALAFVLTLPNIVVWHQGWGMAGELWQAALVVCVGVFVGRRADRERRARLEAELREKQRQASEERYRGLFEAAADPILLLDEDGVVLEANQAAMALCLEDLRGMQVREEEPLLWRAIQEAPQEACGAIRPGALAIEHVGGQMWVEPAIVRFRDADGRSHVLTQLHDVTPTVERQRLVEEFARRTVATREEERRRVARDLHDGPLQSLVLLWRELEALEGSSCHEGQQAMVEARGRVEEVAAELRRFSRDLRPSILDDLGLAPALKAEAQAFAGRAGLKVEFTARGEWRRLPTDVELALLRICQEALRNVERHASAGLVRLRLELDEERYRLSVADDGVGLVSLPSAADLLADGRLGVVGMQERARLVGAECFVGRRHGASTVVEVAGAVAGEYPDR
jgi:PAS domain S-box-containing protein